MGLKNMSHGVKKRKEKKDYKQYNRINSDDKKIMNNQTNKRACVHVVIIQQWFPQVFDTWSSFPQACTTALHCVFAGNDREKATQES